MENSYIYKNIRQLKTPVGYFAIYGREAISFSVTRSLFDLPSQIYSESGDIIRDPHRNELYN